jgi:hypothetical protein
MSAELRVVTMTPRDELALMGQIKKPSTKQDREPLSAEEERYRKNFKRRLMRRLGHVRAVLLPKKGRGAS